MILEESENLDLHRVVTVKSNRGDEYIINADAAIEALVQLFSDYDNEKRFGWDLGAGWFEQEFAKLRRCSVSSNNSDAKS